MAEVNLNFESGTRTLELTATNGQSVEVKYNPYDVMLIGTIMDAAEKLDEIQKRLTSIKSEDWREVYKACMDADKEMRGILDGIFNVPICDALFSGQTVQAIGNGFPAWANLLCAILDVMDTGLAEEKTKAQSRIRKYSSKYKK